MKMTGLQLIFVALLSTPVIVAEDLDPVEFLISKNNPRNSKMIPLPKDFDKFGDQKNDCCALQLFIEVKDYKADGTGNGDGYSDNESQTETGSVTFNFEHPEIRKSDIKFTMSVEKDKDNVRSKHLLNLDNCTNIMYKTFNISATTTIVDVKDVRVVLVNGKDQKIVCSDPNLAPDPREDQPGNWMTIQILIFLCGVLMCVSILVYCTNSLGIDYKGNFIGSSSALAQSPSSTTAAGEEALFGCMLKIQFEDTDYKEKLLPFFKNLSDLLKKDPSINFDFYDFYSEKQAFHVSDVFGAPSHLPVHSGVVLTMVLSNPDLHLNIHIDLEPHSFNPSVQKYNLVKFKMTKGPVKGTYRGDVHSTLPELIEKIKLTMNEMGNEYTFTNKNCIRFKDILLEKLKLVKVQTRSERYIIIQFEGILG